jgi:raffinose/stachyose/melibiose transport system permease protein
VTDLHVEGSSAAPVFARTSSARRSLRGRLFRTFMVAAVALLLFVVIYPLIWIVLQSFKTEGEFTLSSVWALPHGLYFHNWTEAWTTGNIQTYVKNSALVTFPSLFFIIVLSLSAAFGLEVMKWRGRNGVLFLFIAGILIPAQMVLLPMFTIYFHLHLIDSRWGLIIAYTAFGLPLAIFLMASYFRVVPRELLEAATLDGANIYRSFFLIALPMVSNAIFTVALVEFFFIWNDLLLSLTFISSDSKRTIQTGLLNFTGQYGQIALGPTFAAVTMTVLPTLVLYLILNQRVMKGLTGGALKG